MLIKQGIKVSPGVAICQALVVDAEDQPIPRRTVARDAVGAEHDRLKEALAASIKDIEDLRKQASAKLGPDLSKIFDVHLLMLQDKHLTTQFQQAIDAEHLTAEFAVYSVMRRQAQVFRLMENRYFKDRANDVWDLEQRILGHLIGRQHEQLTSLRSEVAIVAHDLTPSQTAGLDRAKVRAIVTDAGGQTSHTAILAHALGIPAIVGLEDVSRHVNTGDTIIVDGHKGLVIIGPDAAQLMEYRLQQRHIAALETQYDEVANLPAVTRDGTSVTILANIEFPDEVQAALNRGAVGVGLYRTEFLFLAAEHEPTEEQQYETYRQAVKMLKGKTLVIRTLDLGADKVLRNDGSEMVEPNPFLGCRSIRLCLQNLPLFKTQLRAILRASVDGPVSIMFPLISNLMELRQAKMILSDVMEDLDDQGIAYRSNIPVGIMVEVPSVALDAAKYCREVSFFSIGTNDLIQYTVAVDRGNERIASLYSAAHPAVIKLIKEVIRTANRYKTDVSLCGEMAGDPMFAVLLLGLGLRTLSMTPPAIPEVKRVIRSVSIDQCQRIARKVSAFDSDREVMNYLRDELRKMVPEVFDGRSAER